MDLTIYVLGDVRLFADTLNGIAMMFTVPNGETITLWASNTNSMGLGMGAFLGTLIALSIMVYSAAFKSRIDIKTLIAPLILYIIMTVPKVTVNIVDRYYTNGAQTVANVPLGLALPMSIISGIAITATDTLETIFITPSVTGLNSKISEDGFVMPLKLLHAMRYTGLTIQDGYPNVTDSMAEILKICLTNNLAFNLQEFQTSSNSMTVLMSALQNPTVSSRLVKIYPYDPTGSNSGKVVSCSESGEYLEKTIRGYLSGRLDNGAVTLISPDQLKVKNFATDVEKIMSSQNGGGANRNTTMTGSDYQSSIENISEVLIGMTNSNNEEVLRFAEATILNPILSTATECVDGVNNRATARCLTYSSTYEQWKERSAAEASGFLSMMRDGQNLLILLSVILFPIMVLIIAIQGAGGMKVVLSYLLYTISAYMWIPVAAMVNFYVQVQLNDELTRWRARIPSGVGVAETYFSIANAPLFYDAISKKLALANSVMASVPMICMGLFGGMLMTMNRLADKMNPQSGYNASVNTPDPIKRDALASVGSSVSFDNNNSVGKITGLADSGKFSESSQIAQSISKSNDYARKRDQVLTKSFGEQLVSGQESAFTKSITDTATKGLGFKETETGELAKIKSTVESSMAGYGYAAVYANDHSTNASVADRLVATATQTLGASAGAKLSAQKLGGATNAELAASIQKQAQQQFDVAMGEASKHGTQGQFNNGKQNIDSNGTTGKYAIGQQSERSLSHQIAAATAKTWSEKKSLLQSENAQKSFSDSISQAETFNRSAQQQLQQASSFEMSGAELVNANKNRNGEISQAAERMYQSFSPEMKGRVDQLQRDMKGRTANSGDAEATRLQAIQTAVRQMGSDEQKANFNAIAFGALGSQNIQSVNEDPNFMRNFDKLPTKVSEATEGVEDINGVNFDKKYVRSEGQQITGEVDSNASKFKSGASQNAWNPLNQVGEGVPSRIKSNNKMEEDLKQENQNIDGNSKPQSRNNDYSSVTTASPDNGVIVNTMAKWNDNAERKLQENIGKTLDSDNNVLTRLNSLGGVIGSAAVLGATNIVADNQNVRVVRQEKGKDGNYGPEETEDMTRGDARRQGLTGPKTITDFKDRDNAARNADAKSEALKKLMQE